MAFVKQVVVWILTFEAKLILRRYRPKIIAVTGSVGKTTTKDAIYAALAGTPARPGGRTGGLHVRKSEKSFNSDIGVPLTILGLENAWKNPLRWALNIARGLFLLFEKAPYPAWLVLEVGADRPGDIRRLARWLTPDIVVITGVPDVPVHVEFFDSPEALAREKRALAEHMTADGKLVLNGDDARMVALCATYKDRTVTYGIGKANDFSASHHGIMYEKGKPTGTRFRLVHGDTTLPVSVVGALGASRAYAALAAFAVAEIAGVGSEVVVQALAEWTPPPGRMRVLPGVNGSVLIDDTYNSSPAAALSALETLKETKIPDGARRIVVLGDMLELGKYSSEAHRQIGAHTAHCADLLITVGFRARAMAEAALDAGLPESLIRQYELNESRRAGEELRDELREGDVVLIKGSQSVRMERTVEALMAEPEHAVDLLVRQEPEWIIR